MTEGLTECRVCGGQVAQQALQCPHCGAKLKSSDVEKIFMLLFAALILVVTCYLMGMC